jgi:hypothetical protein
VSPSQILSAIVEDSMEIMEREALNVVAALQAVNGGRATPEQEYIFTHYHCRGNRPVLERVLARLGLVMDEEERVFNRQSGEWEPREGR